MALYPYTITAIAKNTNETSNIVPGAMVSLLDSDGIAVVMYDDAAGSNGSTGKVADTRGQVTVYVEQGEYSLNVNGTANGKFVVSSSEKQTTLALINSTSPYQTGDTVTTSGFTAGGDGGGSQWKKSALVDTPSQSPAQRGDGTLTDATGAVWVIVTGAINPVSLGADKSGINDSTSSIQAALNFAASNSIQCKLSAGVYLITQQLTHTSAASNFSFIGAGSSVTEFVCNFPDSGSAIKVFNKSKFAIGGFTVQGNFSTGSQVIQGVDLAHITGGYIGDIEVHNVEGQGCWVVSGNNTITNENVLVDNVRAYDCGSSGVQIQGARNSGIINSYAKDCGTLWQTNGGSGSGVYMKTPLEDCFHDNNTAENIPLGAFNVGSSFPGIKAVRLTWSNGRAVNCKRGLRIGEVEDSTFTNFSLGLDGTNDSGLGDALRLENGAKRNSFKNICTKAVGASRAAVRILTGTEDNEVDLVSNTESTAGAVLVTFETSTRNTVVVSKQAHDSVTTPVTNAGTENSYTIKGRNRVQRAEIASGSVALESIGVKRLLLDSEAGASTDDLDTINGGVDGMTISVSTFSDGEDITLTEAGNMRLSGSFTLDRASDTITLVYSDRVGRWLEISRGDNLA